jgi:hypothetical protein
MIGTRIVMNRSMWTIGLSVIRPSSRAVVSPKAKAERACAHSCTESDRMSNTMVSALPSGSFVKLGTIASVGTTNKSPLPESNRRTKFGWSFRLGAPSRRNVSDGSPHRSRSAAS